jgi:monomeric sarcosine oxidase
VHQPRIVIVGAGIIGLSTAYALLKQGMKDVTVLEQAAVDHRRSTSRGLSRLLRFEYGADRFYSELVRLSLYRWKNLEYLSQRQLYTRTGLLVLGKEDDQFITPSYHVLHTLGLPTGHLSRSHCIQQFPQFNTQPYDLFTYNQEAGMLEASLCLKTLRDLIHDLGGTIYESQRVIHMSAGNQSQPLRLHLSSGERLNADRMVLATGPWVHRLLGDLRLPIRLTRQYLFYFSNVAIASFSRNIFPAFMAGDLYGFPLHNSCTGRGPAWLKVASHTFGVPVNPDDPPTISKKAITYIKLLLYDLLPALKNARLAHIDACIYDVSPDEDFILDYLPDDRRVVFATGLTGHGFKFGPLLGEFLSSMLRETEPEVPLTRFQAARFAPQRSAETISLA